MRIFIPAVIFSLVVFSFARAASTVPPVGLSVEAIVGAPTPVVLNTPFNVTSNSLDISWSENFDGDFLQYEMYYSTTSGVTTSDTMATYVSSSATLNYHFTGLNSNQAYYFDVAVRNTLGLTSLSNEVFTVTSGGGGNPKVYPVPETPELLDFIESNTVPETVCPAFSNPMTLTGIKTGDIEQVLVNSSPADSYPTPLTWEKLATVLMGPNLFEVIGISVFNVFSEPKQFIVERLEIGDTNGDNQINDFDLSGLALNWATGWCYADFNNDAMIDDFDLAGLAGHWN